MAAQIRLRSQVAMHLANIVASRGDAPVIVVPGDVEDIDMAAVVRDLAEAMGYESNTMRLGFFETSSGFFDAPMEPSIAPSQRDRLHVLDDRDPRRQGAKGTADEVIAAVVSHIAASGGVRTPIVVVSRLAASEIRDQAELLRQATRLSERDLVAL